LNDQTCEVLGGSVDDLVQKWKLAKVTWYDGISQRIYSVTGECLAHGQTYTNIDWRRSTTGMDSVRNTTQYSRNAR
jgi:hypothetical protein